jgi:hypothetical protein
MKKLNTIVTAIGAHRWIQSFQKSMQLQLFISFISLPFLIGWGLPISLLSPISTLLFGPFLTCFLLVSSLIFFCELLYIPNSWLIVILEKISAIWLSCLRINNRAWLISFTKPSLIILFLIPLVALIIIHSKKISSLAQRTGLLALTLVMLCTLLTFFSYHPNPTVEKIACHKGELTLISHQHNLIILDPGFLASRPSYESYIAYTLVPDIVKRTGKLSLDHLIIGKINHRMLEALHFLATKMTIKNLYLPYWKGKIPPFAWRSYIKLKKTIMQLGGKIHAISYKKQLYKDKTGDLYIAPIASPLVSYYEATYQQLDLIGTIQDTPITSF